MNRISIIRSIVFFVGITTGVAFAQCADSSHVKSEEIEWIAQYEGFSEQDISMLKILRKDFKEDPFFRKEKADCYVRYIKLLFQTIYSQLTSPVGYIGYYVFRREITQRLEQFYEEKNLDNIENIGKDIISGAVTEQELKDYLGSFFYGLWLYGDTDSPVTTGGVPDDYKPDKPMFVRRWLYSGVRNPRWNATYVNNYSSPIVAVKTVYDTRQNITTHNYGTGDTKLGMWFRWYVDSKGRWWFFYENTKRTKKNKGKLFYFGSVGMGNQKDGIIIPQKSDKVPKMKQGRFEFSLNRTVKIDE
ncbi:MAG: hypothetical protein IJ681_04825 [Bacteroidales bacterium]|nr:hypothetical protein [Bacteroidales bacterium]